MLTGSAEARSRTRVRDSESPRNFLLAFSADSDGSETASEPSRFMLGIEFAFKLNPQLETGGTPEYRESSWFF